MNSAAGRHVRAVGLAALSGLLTAVGHVAAGGTLPDLAVLLALIPLLAGVFVSLAERSRSTAGTVAALATGQLALHQLMTVLHPAHGDAATMLGLHAAITLVTAGALHHADRTVVALMVALRRVLPRRLIPPPADRPLPTRAVPGSDRPARHARLLSVAHARRGPPVGC